jgi:hypothetical protein
MTGRGRCDCGAGSVVDTATPQGRAALRRAAWGEDQRQRYLKAITRAGAAGSGLGTAAALADGIEGFLPALLVFAACAALFMAIAAVVGYVNERRGRKKVLRPYGAKNDRPLPPVAVEPRSRPRYGVAEGEPFRSPLRHDLCLAFEISLRSENPDTAGNDLLWREAETAGFIVRLDDGDMLRIPAGPIRLAAAPARAQRASHAAARERLPIELRAETDAGLPCVPSDAAFEQIVRPGERAAVLSRLERREDDATPKSSLREPSRFVLVPVGTPALAPLGS